MAKRLAVAGAVVAVLSLLISLMVPAMADKRFVTRTLRLVDRAADDQGHYIDVNVAAKAFPRIGDYFVVSRDSLFVAGSGRRAGSYSGDCTLTVFDREQGPVEAECDLSFHIKGGLITAEGALNFIEGPRKLAITGGTGKYKTAQGQITPQDRPNATIFVFELLL